MKKNVRLLACFTLFIFASNSLFSQQTRSLFNELSQNPELEKVRANKFGEIPSYLKFDSQHQIEIGELKNWMIDHFNFSTNIGFELIRKEDDKLGHTHYRYQQTFNDKPIEGAIWIAHTKANKVYSLNGLIYPSISGENTVGITENNALNYALDYVGAEVYKWQLPKEETHLKWESGDEDATYYPKAEMVYVSQNYQKETYRLTFKFNIYAQKPLSRAYIFVDAITGKIIKRHEIIHHVDEPGNAHTAYSGEREIIADSFGGEFRLRDGSRGNGVRTFDLNQAWEHGGAVDFTDADNDWNNVNPQKDEYATDAHWGSEMTYDYYLEVHGRNSLDNAGFQLNNYVHFGADYYNAFWDGERMTFGDGSGAVTPLTTLDIAGHEVTHGLTSFTANLEYADESGALNESFSDIFGYAIERFARPADWDWLMGAEIGETLRSMSNPNAYESPDTYFGDFWAALGGGDSGGVHTNSGVQNFWFYLMIEGGTGTNDNGDAYIVDAVGIDNSAAIAFRNLTIYLTPSSQFDDARFYAIQSATDLFGECSLEEIQTTNAWHAVGVGTAASEEVIAGFNAPETTGCELPFTVTFSNESVNGIDYLWDFGDATTSTEVSPTHTYTTEGTFDVKLTVDGVACGTDGTDEALETGYITVDVSLDCPVDFPTTGTGATITNCNGTLFDSGGPDGNYGSNQNSQITIAPAGAGAIELNFIEFDIENHVTCIYDNLKIYDGPDDSSPLIDTYCNSNVPTVVNSTGSAITLVFHSDEIVEGTGFKVEWTCSEPIDDSGIEDLDLANSIQIYPNPTNGKFTIDTKTLQNGIIEVTDVIGRKLISTRFNSNLVEVDITKYTVKGVFLVYIKDEKGKTIKVKKLIIH